MFHNTLNDALDAAGPKVKDLWPLGSNINYGETVRHLIETGETYGRRHSPVYRLISVYRNEAGRYETAITYLTA
jgi:hypothetical protein